jgi:hypothetical protein
MGRRTIKKTFCLEKPEEILSRKYRGTKSIPGTNWNYRTHGIGVDIFKAEEVGGIDFDFDKPNPDEWRLTIFFKRQYNEGNLPLTEYCHFMEDEERLIKAIDGALS